jgi:hypothetical protein
MKTLQEQYNLLKEGKGNADVFLKSARRLFPEYVTNSATKEEATTILKQKQIISENFVGFEPITKIESNKTSYETAFAKFLAEEVKVEEKETSKEVEEVQEAAFDYSDPKNIDNLFGEQFLKGYYAEMKDPKNADKDVEELKEMVAKNLAKDRSYYVKNAAFGVKGIGYTDEAPSLGATEEVKGKYAASGMEEVKESSTSLMDLISESLVEAYSEFQRDDKGSKDVDAKDKGEEDAFGAGVEKGEKIEKAKAKKKVKKESIDSKLAEIEKEGKAVTMEAQMDALDELIASKAQRVEMVNEDDDLSELADKKKIKAMQKEIKDLEKRRAKMDKMYEKMCGMKYVKQEIVDETKELNEACGSCGMSPCEC